MTPTGCSAPRGVRSTPLPFPPPDARSPLRWPGIFSLLLLAGCMHPTTAPRDWVVEAQDPTTTVRYEADGTIDIDSPRGVSLWHRRELRGPVRISFEAMAVSANGPNDQVSDLNAFWMATDPKAPGGSVFAARRTGKFEDYDTLTTYYVGIGGNRNTTTRMRRYTGVPGDRPLLPEHDRAGAADMLQAGRWTRITLIADGGRIAVERDGQPLFEMRDPAPYRRGWFAIRTTQSHLKIRDLRISHPTGQDRP